MLPGCARQGAQAVLAAEFVAHARVVHHVVAVQGAGYGLQHRRQVQMRDAERGEIRHGSRGCLERELRLQLEAVRGGRRRIVALRCHGNVRTRK